MLLILLIFLGALGIESIGAYISIMGLSAAFAADPLILIMAATLDFCKVVGVSVLAKKWKQLTYSIKTYMVTSMIILMIITSSGVAGYLSNSFQKTIQGNETQNVLITEMVEEKDRLIARKLEIDKQISEIPSQNAYSKQRMMESFKPESVSIRTRIEEIDKELPQLKIAEIKQHTEVGPIVFLSKQLDISLSQAVMIIIGMIVFVFDPLALVFLITGNLLLNNRAEEKLKLKRQKEEELLKIERDELFNRIHSEKNEEVVEESIVEESIVEESIVEEPIVEEPIVDYRRKRLSKEDYIKPKRKKLDIVPFIKTRRLLIVPKIKIVEKKVEKQIPVIVEKHIPVEKIINTSNAAHYHAPYIETKEPIVEEPIVEEPIVEEPIVEEPIVEEPIVEEPIVEEPIVEEPIELPMKESSLNNVGEYLKGTNAYYLGDKTSINKDILDKYK